MPQLLYQKLPPGPHFGPLSLSRLKWVILNTSQRVPVIVTVIKKSTRTEKGISETKRAKKGSGM
jgi:hypothetical protein